VLLVLLLLQKFYVAPLHDCLLKSAPCPASVKQNEGREERGRVTNRYLAKSGRKPIPGHRASKRKGRTLTDGRPRAGDNKFRLHS